MIEELELPPRGQPIPDDHEPDSWNQRREGLWVIADMEDEKVLVTDAPEPGLLQ